MSDLGRPRILCLHGGGVNAEVFRLQARSYIRFLPDFRLVFADAPWFCNPGPGVKPVYEDFGPFRRWLRWLPEHPPIDDATAVDELKYAIQHAKDEDDGYGPWVGIIGFSQGARMASSLLYDQQIRVERDGEADTDYKFAVIAAGRGPIVSFCEHSQSAACVGAGAMADDSIPIGPNKHILSLPTIHIHGKTDPGLPLHQKFLTEFHDAASTKLFEWDGDHRLAIKTADVQPVTDEIYRIARQSGIAV